MFIFNTELILHDIDNWFQGLLIFAMACFGNFAFASATQGWFVTRNRLYEIPLLLGVTFILMQPGRVIKWLGFGFEQRYWAYLIGMVLFIIIYIIQKTRIAATKNTKLHE